MPGVIQEGRTGTELEGQHHERQPQAAARWAGCRQAVAVAELPGGAAEGQQALRKAGHPVGGDGPASPLDATLHNLHSCLWANGD